MRMTYTMEQRHRAIQEACLRSEERDPLALAVSLMRLPEVRFHGPEHHLLTAAVLSTLWYRARGESPEAHLEKLSARCAQILPGVCGFYGVCGSTLAAGAALSELWGVTYLSGEDWPRLNGFTARVQQAVADSCESGPRCCKRTTFAAILSAEEAPGTAAPLFFCPFYRENRQCVGLRCRFFPGPRDHTV